MTLASQDQGPERNNSLTPDLLWEACLWKLKAATLHPTLLHTHTHTRRRAATHLWTWRVLLRSSLKPWRSCGGRRGGALTRERKRGSGAAALRAVKRKSKFLLLPHKTEDHGNPVHSGSDSSLEQWLTRIPKMGGAGECFRPMGMQRRWAYSTVWIVLSLAPPFLLFWNVARW